MRVAALPPARLAVGREARATQIRRRIIRGSRAGAIGSPGHECDNPRVSQSAPTSLKLFGVNPYVLLTLTPLFWSVNWIFGRGLAPDIPPMTMTFFRWFFAVLILAPFAWPHVKRDWPVVRRYWKTLLFL